jgi:hypothetical protein
MKTFKDNAGRTWSVSVDVDAIRRVRTSLKVKLTSTDFASVLEQLLSDPVLFCDVLYVICKPEADRQKISDEDFGRSMAGDAIEHATAAFLEELANFTPNPRDRARVQRVIRAMWELTEKTRDAAERNLEAEIAKVMTSGPTSGGSPDSSASTPAGSR